MQRVAEEMKKLYETKWKQITDHVSVFVSDKSEINMPNVHTASGIGRRGYVFLAIQSRICTQILL